MRKQARTLENDIDVKLVAFSKLGVSSGSSGLSSESVPLINSDDMFDTMSMELQQLLNKVMTHYHWHKTGLSPNEKDLTLRLLHYTVLGNCRLHQTSSFLRKRATSLNFLEYNSLPLSFDTMLFNKKKKSLWWNLLIEMIEQSINSIN